MGARGGGGARVAVVGAGPAGLMAAERLAAAGRAVELWERRPSPGRRLLLAGQGGLNLTHSEGEAAFLARYAGAGGGGADAVAAAVAAFGCGQGVRRWAEDRLGVPTFVGSSGRVFPEGMRAAPLLRAWLAVLEEAGVELRLRRRLVGVASGPRGRGLRLGFREETAGGALGPTMEYWEGQACVLALGGASYPRLGSDGEWAGEGGSALRGEPCNSGEPPMLDVVPLQPANCGWVAGGGGWSPIFRKKFEGSWAKGIELSVIGPTGDSLASSRGDLVFSARGIEGGPVYAVTGALEAAARAGSGGCITVRIDFQPDMDVNALAKRLGASRKRSTSERLRRAGVAPAAYGLMVERGGRAGATATAHGGAAALAAAVKGVPILLEGPEGLEKAISTSGGVSVGTGPGQVAEGSLMLQGRPEGIFVAGEQLDWNAPTGGYLLTAALATGAAAAAGVDAWLNGENASV